MISIGDYKNPFDAITDFEQSIAKYTGAPYAVVTDSCTHAIELCLRYLDFEYERVTLPSKTYISVPMTLHRLRIPFKYSIIDWDTEYQLSPTRIWDSARRFERDMYRTGQFQCLSFGHTKPLDIGRGGAVLCDDKEAYEWLKLYVYDGRDLNKPYYKQEYLHAGFHYKLNPEECIAGLNKMRNGDIKPSTKAQYPDISGIAIID